MAGNSIYEVNDAQDIPKPSDVTEPDDYREDVFFMTRPEVIDYDDRSHDKNPYYDQCRNDEPVKEMIFDEPRYIHNPRNLDERNTQFVNFWKRYDDKDRDRAQVVMSGYLLDHCPNHNFHIKSGFDKTSKTLDDILNATGFYVSQYVSGTRPRKIKQDLKNLEWWYRVRSNERWSDPAGHVVKVKLFPNPKEIDLRKLDIKLTCSCPFWIWQGPDYNAKNEDYLLGLPMSDGSAPNIMDPNRENKVCKHILAVSEIFHKIAEKHGLDTYKIIKSIETTLNRSNYENLEDIKEIYDRLKNQDKKELLPLIKKLQRQKDESSKKRLKKDIISEIKQILKFKEKKFLEDLDKDLKELFKRVTPIKKSSLERVVFGFLEGDYE